QAVLVLTHQRYGKATGAGTTGATDAVHVVFRHVGQVMVDDHRQLVDVDAARGNVSGDQYLDAVVLEVGQGTGALRLALVAVDGSGLDAKAGEFLHHVVGAVLGAAEHQHL